MITQYFILGRNPELSRQEILSYLQARNKKYTEICFEENYLMIQLPHEININELGGTIKAGIIKKEGSVEEVEEYIYNNDLIHEEKFNYGVFGNLEPDIFKDKFKSEKRKATLKHGRKDLTFQNKKRIKMPKAPHYFILHKHKKNYFYGIINQEYDTSQVEYRDMHKPIRREQLAISPRLAKILINLSGAKEKDLLLDPFCGVAGIIQEALLKKVNCYGSDIDPHAIRDARINLTWLADEYKIKERFTIEQNNAKHIPNKQFSAVATETPLGDLVTKKPNDFASKKIIEKFERMIIPILKHLKTIKKPHAKIAITFPKIRKVGVDIEKICEETNLTKVFEPIYEAHDKQYIGREIIVLQ